MQVTLGMEVTLWSLDHTCLMGSGQKERLNIVQKGAILLPALRSAVFWPLIAPGGAHLAGFVHSWCYLPYSQGMINRGLSGSSIEDGMSSNSAILALYFDFLVPPRSPFQHPAFKLC